MDERKSERRGPGLMWQGVTWGVVLCLLAGSALPARAEPVLPLSTTPIGATDKETQIQSVNILLRAALAEPILRDSATAAWKAVTVVFVPGILGSAIQQNGRDVWGPSLSVIDVLRPEHLGLSAPWIGSEEVDSSVQTEVLTKIFGLDQYGETMKELKAIIADRLGLGFVGCGYDWRRDIRAGAAYLNRCLEQHKLLDPSKTVIFIAHSMGGIVTWTWHELYYREGARDRLPRVRGVAFLGSPLEGSCEMLRMMRKGYAQPILEIHPTVDGALKQLAERAKSFWKTKRQELVNKISEALSRDTIRPVIFTWPGAFELLPRVGEGYRESCVNTANENEGFGRPWNHFKDDFWTNTLGGDVRGNVPVSSAMRAAVGKAADFRTWFRQKGRERLTVPVSVFRSTVWLTPSLLAVVDGRLAADGPTAYELVTGDGRVADTSAVMYGSGPTGIIGNRRLISHLVGTTYVHGSLPLDPKVLELLLRQQLPMIVNAHALLAVAQTLPTASDQVVRNFVQRAEGRTFDWAGIFTHLELNLQGDPGSRNEILGAEETQRDRDVVDAAKGELRRRGGVTPEPYDAAKKLHQEVKAQAERTKQPAPAAALQQAAAQLTRVPDSGDTPENLIFARARRGLALTEARDYLAAADVLLRAYEPLMQIPPSYDRRAPQKIEQLQRDVQANLGIALFEIGACEAARTYLGLPASRTNPWARERYDQGVCRDRATGKEIRLATTPPAGKSP